MTAPRYQPLLEREIPVVRLPADGGSVRVIAGEFAGTTGPARTVTPVNLLDVRLRARHRLRLDLRDGYTGALYVLRGKIAVNVDETANAGELVVFGRRGDEVTLEAASDATVFVLNGQPINEPIVGYGPFVMNTPEQIRRAFADYSSGRMGILPALTE